MAEHLSLRLGSSPNGIGVVTDCVDQFLRDNDVPVTGAQVFGLVLDEILTNALAYGGKSDGPFFIEVNVEVEGTVVRIEVVDDGIAFNPLLMPDPDVTLELEEREIGGLGIFLVKKLMDDVTYERRDDFNRLTLTKDCASAGD